MKSKKIVIHEKISHLVGKFSTLDINVHNTSYFFN